MRLMLMFDPFRDFDRLTRQVLGSTARPAVMPMDAWREGDRFVVEFDLPGVKAESLDVNVENEVLTVRAERPEADNGGQWLATERPHGVFSRQILIGKNLDTNNIEASYHDGVLRLTIPVAEEAKPKKIAVTSGAQRQAINA
ncbi:HSP20 family small heat-shock protein [Mycolicibacterium austroafricanum]|uniref:HSP20 family small heat-shock protein n=2 Tax=Mycobacteriaceae TaxID=1762 RepID=A0ABT8H8Z5_MYCAO|nr:MULTISPECIES: HSP20 family small heat-shock protein [Mycobacteriaceae]MDN4517221.1 HSP20 family small heat-shock protein [Mycolicibacterium austroafricanum]